MSQSVETTHTVAQALVSLCREGRFVEAQEQLYADEVISLQPASPLFEPRLQGREAIIAREKRLQQFLASLRVINVSEPIVADGFFSLSMTTEVTPPGAEPQQRIEICVYQISDGKIVLEQFFF